jgi:excisionase family DNA binding protein
MKKAEKFLKIEEVSEVLNLNPYTVRRLCREDKIPCFKVGGQWRFRLDQIKGMQKCNNSNSIRCSNMHKK